MAITSFQASFSPDEITPPPLITSHTACALWPFSGCGRGHGFEAKHPTSLSAEAAWSPLSHGLLDTEDSLTQRETHR